MIQMHDYRIPDDISVIGFDNSDDSQYLSCPVMTGWFSKSSGTRLCSFDLFYLTLNFMIVYIALIVFYEKVLRDKCKELFIRIMSNPKKDKQG